MAETTHANGGFRSAFSPGAFGREPCLQTLYILEPVTGACYWIIMSVEAAWFAKRLYSVFASYMSTCRCSEGVLRPRLVTHVEVRGQQAHEQQAYLL